jgi:hypothetical protein
MLPLSSNPPFCASCVQEAPQPHVAAAMAAQQGAAAFMGSARGLFKLNMAMPPLGRMFRTESGDMPAQPTASIAQSAANGTGIFVDLGL